MEVVLVEDHFFLVALMERTVQLACQNQWALQQLNDVLEQWENFPASSLTDLRSSL